MEQSKLLKMTITQLKLALEKGITTSEEATKACLDAIENSNTNSVVHINKDALKEAKQADEEYKKGTSTKKLLGIPILLKANMCTNDTMPTSCCSKYLENFYSPYNATIVDKLKAEGAIILGKTNMDEFAFGSSNENSYYGACKNPLDITRVPGGSSGGSAAAVAENLCYAALGSDTGGSIRQPASLCGVVGLKPTYGTVSRRGLVAFASSLDQIGPITKTVEDNMLIYEIIKGKDEKDSTTSECTKNKSINLKKPIKGIKLGIAKEYFSLPANQEIIDAVNKVIDYYKSAGVEIVDISLPNIEKSLAVYYVISSAEAASNLSRFDGIRYGERSIDAKTITDIYYKSRTEGFGEEVKRRIMLGNYVLSSGFYEAYYKKATKVQQLIKNEFNEAFKKCDVIISPVCPQVAWKFGEKTSPIDNYMSDIYTVPVNITGKPAITYCCGRGESGMPIGVQLIANDYCEDILYRMAANYEFRG